MEEKTLYNAFGGHNNLKGLQSLSRGVLTVFRAIQLSLAVENPNLLRRLKQFSTKTVIIREKTCQI